MTQWNYIYDGVFFRRFFLNFIFFKQLNTYKIRITSFLPTRSLISYGNKKSLFYHCMHLHQKWECWGRKHYPSLLWMRMWKGCRQWSHISTSPAKLNTPLDKCRSSSFHVSVLHKITCIESGGLAFPFPTCGIKNQSFRNACSAQRKCGTGTTFRHQTQVSK